MFRIKALVSVTALALLQIGYGQSSRIDSLKSAITYKLDTVDVETYRNLGYDFRKYNKDSSLYYLKKSVDLAHKIGFTVGEAKSIFSMAVTHGMSGDHPEALGYLDQCEKLAQRVNDLDRIIYINNTRGIIYKNIGDYPTSHSFYLRNIRLVDSLKLDVSLSSTYSNLGILYDLMEEREKSLAAYDSAIATYTGPDKKDIKRNVKANIGVMEFSDQNYQKALDIFLSLKPSYEADNDRFEMSGNYSNIGNCYQELDQPEMAEEFLLKSLDIAKELDLTRQIAISSRNLSKLMFRQGRIEEARKYYNDALKVLEGQGHYEWKKKIHETASNVEEGSGNLEKANYHLKQYILYNDSLVDETKVQELSKLEARHDVYMKNKEIAQKELEVSLLNARIDLENRRKIFLIVTSALLLITGGVLIVANRRKTKTNQILQEKNELISQQKEQISQMNFELEKRMLRAQMNPHFIFNSLNSIQHFITVNDKRSALTYLTKFSKLLRQILEDSITTNIILEDEINLLKIYVQLEALRFDDSFSYEFKVDEELDTYLYEVPILLVQPYIENAIIHGLMPKVGDKKLSVQFIDKDDCILCTIEDNGVGRNHKMQGEKSNKRPSRGMSVTAQRIKAMQKGNEELVSIDDLNNSNGMTGTKVTVTIPKS
ncbi:tetratricopeptide repeat protein [Marinoscillum sp. MHG1-6]|uniref:tetratricopeptide repeat-containing sensor histidine kinase n=1 Tax=Marinoscillum sp. MHG1-6 TaxID=2959627 RepID=UPI002156F800|nr:tetratricopeptide repeat protein [Marinoscillum sp. MHG1-6]